VLLLKGDTLTRFWGFSMGKLTKHPKTGDDGWVWETGRDGLRTGIDESRRDQLAILCVGTDAEPRISGSIGRLRRVF